MGYSKTHNEITEALFNQARALAVGTEMFIPCDDASHAASVKTRLYAARKTYSEINATEADRITFSVKFKDNAYWVQARKSAIDPTTFFIVGADGKTQQHSIKPSRSRMRKIVTMLNDEIEPEEIEKMLAPLSEDERDFLYGVDEDES